MLFYFFYLLYLALEMIVALAIIGASILTVVIVIIALLCMIRRASTKRKQETAWVHTRFIQHSRVTLKTTCPMLLLCLKWTTWETLLNHYQASFKVQIGMAWKASGDHVHLGITKYFLSLPQVTGIGFEPPINSSIWFYQGFKRFQLSRVFV